jgi:DNA-binding CsgD family transcriptional regulator/PAS domain-containing protein
MASLFGSSRDELVQRCATDLVVDEAAARARLELLAGGELDGYRVLGRTYRRADGTTFVVDACVSTYTEATPARYAVGVLLPEDEAALLTPGVTDPSSVVVLGTVDAEWHVDRISADVGRLLGYPAARVIGRSISTLLDPADLPALLVGVGHGLQAPGGATMRLRLRTAGSKSRQFRMLVTRLVGNPLEDLGFAFAITDPSRPPVADRAWELESLIQRIAREVAATGVLAGLFGTPAATRVPAMAGLSSREIEIVTGLLVGERVPMIAQRLYLSESTVRNHLTSVYRKLGVRSQQELLTLLRADGPAANSGGFA